MTPGGHKMERWTNDYKIAERIFLGYRPVLPLQTKVVGAGVSAVLMETPDADYKASQENRQIRNDMLSPTGGKALERYIEQEFKIRLHLMSKWGIFKLLIGKLFRTGY